MGLHPAHAKTMSVVHNLKLRRRLSRFFADLAYRTKKMWYSSRRLVMRESKA